MKATHILSVKVGKFATEEDFEPSAVWVGKGTWGCVVTQRVAIESGQFVGATRAFAVDVLDVLRDTDYLVSLVSIPE